METFNPSTEEECNQTVDKHADEIIIIVLQQGGERYKMSQR